MLMSLDNYNNESGEDIGNMLYFGIKQKWVLEKLKKVHNKNFGEIKNTLKEYIGMYE